MSSSSAPISAAGGGGQQLQSMQVGVMRASNRAMGCEAAKLPSHFPPSSFVVPCLTPSPRDRELEPEQRGHDDSTHALSLSYRP